MRKKVQVRSDYTNNDGINNDGGSLGNHRTVDDHFGDVTRGGLELLVSTISEYL